jgi:hypothetical protein
MYSNAAWPTESRTTGQANFTLLAEIGNASDDAGSFKMWFGATDGAVDKRFSWWGNAGEASSTSNKGVFGHAIVNDTSAIDGLRFASSSGNITSGRFILRGRRRNPQTGPTLSGQWEKITRVEEAGAATMDFDWETGNYEILKLECADITPSVDDRVLWLRVRQAETTLSGAADYGWGFREMDFAGNLETPQTDSSDSEISVNQNNGTGTNESTSFSVLIFDPDITGHRRMTWRGQQLDSTPEQQMYRGAGFFMGNTTAVDGLTLLMATGNIAGNCTLLGRRR